MNIAELRVVHISTPAQNAAMSMWPQLRRTLWRINGAAGSERRLQRPALPALLRSCQQQLWRRPRGLCACGRLPSRQLPMQGSRGVSSVPCHSISTNHDHHPDGQQREPSDAESADPVDLLLYRGRWILPIRWCLRLKLFQAAGALSVANLMFVDPSSSTDVLIATSLVVSEPRRRRLLWCTSAPNA